MDIGSSWFFQREDEESYEGAWWDDPLEEPSRDEAEENEDEPEVFPLADVDSFETSIATSPRTPRIDDEDHVEEKEDDKKKEEEEEEEVLEKDLATAAPEKGEQNPENTLGLVPIPGRRKLPATFGLWKTQAKADPEAS